MKTSKPITVEIVRPRPNDHRHYAKRNLDLCTRIGRRIDAVVDLLQPLGASGRWRDGLDMGLISTLASTAQSDLLHIRQHLQELEDNLTRHCTDYDQSNAVCAALDHNSALQNIFNDSERRQDYADELLHDILKGRTDW